VNAKSQEEYVHGCHLGWMIEGGHCISREVAGINL